MPPAAQQHSAEPTVSTCPAGESFPLPQPAEYARELKRPQKLVNEQRLLGREIVVVMGVGFVGAVMAGVVADSVDKKSGNPTKFVIGMQRPSPRSFWKIHYINRGLAPVQAEDPEVAPMIRRCVLEKKTLTATFTYDALSLADVVVVDVQCDYLKETLGNVRQGHADIAALEDSLKVVGEKINPECLVLIETTVPPGTTEYVAYPIIKKAFERRFKQTSADPLSPRHSALSPQHSVLIPYWLIRSSVSCPAGTMCHPSGISGESAAA